MARKDDDEPAPKKSGSGYGMLLGILGGVAVVLVTCCCCLPGGAGGYWWWSAKTTAEAQQKMGEDEKGLALTAEELSLAYVANQAGADAKFKDKVLTVSGRVIYITGDSVRLAPGVLPGQITLGGVYCTFGDKYKSQVLNLKVNDQVTI